MSKSDDIPSDLLKIKVPEGLPKETGFFEITGTAESEAVNSRIYRWLLDREENPILAPLFCNALLAVAGRKLEDPSRAERLSAGKYTSELEVTTSNRKRIDILLDDPEAESAIMIENKLYHSVKNDLQSYWDHRSYPESQKLGILLTLKPVAVPEEVDAKFVNVTHIEWIEAIESAGIPCGIPLHTYGMMTDFFDSIRKQSINKSINIQAQFVFDHPALVASARDCLNEAISYIRGEIRGATDRLAITPRFRNDRYCYLMEKKNSEDGHHEDAYYTVIFEQLVQNHNPKIAVVLELYGDGKTHVKELDREVKAKLESDSLQALPESKLSSGLHFRKKEIPINFEQIASLSEILVQTIRDEFRPVMRVVRERLDELTESS